MRRILFPFLFLAIGGCLGIGAAIFLGDTQQPGPSESSAKMEKATEQDDEPRNAEYVKLNNQFVIPVVEHERVVSHVIISLSLEASEGSREEIFAREPKLRDGFLRVLFDHSNMGGFQGAFTRAENLEVLRRGLRDVAKAELGDDILDVLILDIARQDV